MRNAEYYVRPAATEHLGIDSGITLARQCRSWIDVNKEDEILLGHLLRIGGGCGADTFGGPPLSLIAYNGDGFRRLATYGWWWDEIINDRRLGWLHHHTGTVLVPREGVGIS